jgi:uncharacterized protein (DUF58 family)
MRSNSLFKLLKPPRGFRLTKAGRIFFAFLICLIIIALATGNNLLYLILAGMMSFMIVSGIESELNLRYLELERVLPAEIYAGIAVRIGYLVRNQRNNSSRLLLSDVSRIKIERISREETDSVHSEVTFARRGYATLGRVVISTTYPYGLFEKSISFPLEDRALVFPEPRPFEPVYSSGQRDTGTGKAKDSISHVRSYLPGDPLSSIVWKKQNQGLVSRVFEGGAGMAGLLVLNPGLDMEMKLSCASYVISELHRTGRPFGLVINRYFSGIALSRPHKIKIMEQLALAEEIGQPVLESIPNDSQIIYI